MRNCARELERRGHRFHSRTDTETVLAAFLEWDTDVLRASCAACSAWRCGRNPRGGWCWRATAWASSRCISRGAAPDLYFGSELKAIFVHPEIERRICLEALDCYLSLNYVPGPWTLVEGMEKLRPGHWLEWREGKVRSEAYWSLPVERRRAAYRGCLDDAAAELDALAASTRCASICSPMCRWACG